MCLFTINFYWKSFRGFISLKSKITQEASAYDTCQKNTLPKAFTYDVTLGDRIEETKDAQAENIHSRDLG